MVIAKLIEALYRRGFELDGSFKLWVQSCNSISEQTTTEATLSPSQLKIAMTSVETAMKEAIKIAFGTDTYSFFSELNPSDNFKFDIAEIQSFLAFKGKAKVTGEMVHVTHYSTVSRMYQYSKHLSIYTRRRTSANPCD